MRLTIGIFKSYVYILLSPSILLSLLLFPQTTKPNQSCLVYLSLHCPRLAWRHHGLGFVDSDAVRRHLFDQRFAFLGRWWCGSGWGQSSLLQWFRWAGPHVLLLEKQDTINYDLATFLPFNICFFCYRERTFLPEGVPSTANLGQIPKFSKIHTDLQGPPEV